MIKVFKIVAIALLLLIIISILFLATMESPPIWTGFGERKISDNIEPAKNLFDWLELLVIPVVIALIGWLYNVTEKSKSEKIEKEKNSHETLNSYLGTMTELLKDYENKNSSEKQTLANIKTRTNLALLQVDGNRKGQILQFLYDSNLIDTYAKAKLQSLYLNLYGLNFNDVVLDYIFLQDAYITGAFMKSSSIKNSNLDNANFNSCDFENSDFSNSTIKNTDFEFANLKNCKLINIDMTTAIFAGADLTNANLNGSTLTEKQYEEFKSIKGIKIKNVSII